MSYLYNQTLPPNWSSFGFCHRVNPFNRFVKVQATLDFVTILGDKSSFEAKVKWAARNHDNVSSGADILWSFNTDAFLASSLEGVGYFMRRPVEITSL